MGGGVLNFINLVKVLPFTPYKHVPERYWTNQSGKYHKSVCIGLKYKYTFQFAFHISKVCRTEP